MFLSPNQVPYRDQYFILKQVGLGPDDGFQLNTVWVQLFNAMGIWPAIYASLLIPSGRSGNKVRSLQLAQVSKAQLALLHMQASSSLLSTECRYHP